MNLVITQALATGLPVITTRHSGLPDQVVEGKNGFLVPEGDYHQLAQKIIYYLDHCETWPSLSCGARQHTLENYDNGPLIDRQVAIYKSLVDFYDTE